MKIRWTKNSVRFRITPSELETLTRGEQISEALGGNEGFIQKLFELGSWQACIKHGQKTSLQFHQARLTVELSSADVANLAKSDTEGVYFSTGGENSIRYFVEKDFPCAHPRASEVAESPDETFTAPPDFEKRKNQENP